MSKARVNPLLVIAALLPVRLQAAPAALPARPNLIANPGLEGAAPGGLPAHWSALVLGVPAQFALDAGEKHSGRSCVRITAPEVTRAYVRSDPIEVAPGEQLRIGAWVETRDVPPDQGTVIVIAAFTRADGRGEQLAKVGVFDFGLRIVDGGLPEHPSQDPQSAIRNPQSAAPQSAIRNPQSNGGWQHVEGTVTVPALAARLRVRLGFSYSRGTSWWDDVTVQPLQPLVARIELAGTRVSPALAALPVRVLNRAGRRGPVRLRVQLGAGETAADAVLTGAPAQRVAAPLKVAQRGRLTLRASLFAPGQEAPLFSEQRAVTVPPPLVLLPPIPTHWVREDGAPQLEGELELAVSAAERAQSVLDVRLLDAAGRTRAEWSRAAARVAPDGITRFALRAPGLPEGEYRLVARRRRLGEAGSPTLRAGTRVASPGPPAEQPWAVIPRQRVQVTLNAEGYLEQDGKAIFPLGLFNGGARMEEAAAAGFTVAHAYNAVRVEPGERPNDARASDFLDRAGKTGMRVLFLVPMRLAIAGDWEGFRRRIRMFRNHPALLAWDEEEGIARGDMKPATLEKIRRVLREEDPRHPLMVGDSRDVIGRVTDRSNFFPVPAMELGMWWWYPLPLGPKPGDALRGEELARSFELAPPSFLTLRKTDKPIWVGVQSYKKPRADARYPTPAEYRAQAYIALIHGARGLLWYGGSVTGGLFLAPQEGHWDDLKKLASELNSLAPVLMSPSAAPPAFAPAGAPISVALKRGAGRSVLLAANRGPKAVEVTFHLPDLARASVPVLSENRAVTAAAGELRDHFEPYAAHVYELPSP